MIICGTSEFLSFSFRCEQLDAERREAERRVLLLEAELACERRLTSELATDLAGRLRELFSQLPGPEHKVAFRLIYLRDGSGGFWCVGGMFHV
jgi:hypothetical protein